MQHNTILHRASRIKQMSIIPVLMMLVGGVRAPEVVAQEASVNFVLETGSRLWLTGTTTMGDYECAAAHVDGTGRIRSDSLSKVVSSGADSKTSTVRVSVNVRSLDCGNGMMNDDMFTAMKADSSPDIVYTLMSSEVVPDSGKVDSVRAVNTIGQLTIAGITQMVRIRVTIRRLASTRYRILGSTVLSMHDFGITPPSALWGLIRAADKLVVKFNLIAVENTSTTRVSRPNGN